MAHVSCWWKLISSIGESSLVAFQAFPSSQKSPWIHQKSLHIKGCLSGIEEEHLEWPESRGAIYVGWCPKSFSKKESSNLPGWKMAMVQVLVGDGTCWQHHLWWGGYESYFCWGGERRHKRHVLHMWYTRAHPGKKAENMLAPKKGTGPPQSPQNGVLHMELRNAFWCILGAPL